MVAAASCFAAHTRRSAASNSPARENPWNGLLGGAPANHLGSPLRARSPSRGHCRLASRLSAAVPRPKGLGKGSHRPWCPKSKIKQHFSAVVSTSRVSLFRLHSRRSMTWQVHTVDGESSFCFAAFRNRKTHARNSPDEKCSLGRLSIQSLSQPRKPDTTNLIHTKQNNFPQRLPGWPGEDCRQLPAGNGQALRALFRELGPQGIKRLGNSGELRGRLLLGGSSVSALFWGLGRHRGGGCTAAGMPQLIVAPLYSANPVSLAGSSQPGQAKISFGAFRARSPLAVSTLNGNG